MELMRDRINTFFKYKDLLRELVVRDLKLKYRRQFSRIPLEHIESIAHYDCNDDCIFPYVPGRN